MLGIDWRPALHSRYIKGTLPVNAWWEQTVYIQGTVRLTRRSLTLGAADKDGGAHVDPNLSAEYESLMNREGKGFWNVEDRSESVPIKNAHLVFMRQLGYELLSSPELLAFVA